MNNQTFTPQLPIYIASASSIHPNGVCNAEGWLEAAEPEYLDIITDARLRRRMSKIVRMGVASGLLCLQNEPDLALDAIITASGLGCLQDTERFLDSIKSQDEQLLSPTPFIQSTFNTIGGQLALILQQECYNTTYVHRSFSFESALLDALLLLESGEATHVLVGAMDEATPTLHDLLMKSGSELPAPVGEGASFFWLTSKRRTNVLAQITSISFGYTPSFHSISDAAILQISSEEYLRKVGCYFTASAYGLWQACTSEHVGFQQAEVAHSFLGQHTRISLAYLQ